MNANDWEVFDDKVWLHAVPVKIGPQMRSLNRHTGFQETYTAAIAKNATAWQRAYPKDAPLAGKAKLAALHKMGILPAVEEPPVAAPAVATLPSWLTKREDFAKAAMQGMIANDGWPAREETQIEIARISFQCADVMLAESAKSETE